MSTTIPLTAAQIATLSSGKTVSIVEGSLSLILTPFTTSPTGTLLTAPTTAVITDTAGNTWGINTAALVTVNGIADTTTANVTRLYWDGEKLSQENTAGGWWYKTSPTASWVSESSPLVSTSTKSTILSLLATLKTQGKTLSGQYADIWTANGTAAQATASLVSLQNQTGEWPAILGVILNEATNSYAYNPAVGASLCAQQWALGGIVELTLWSNVPNAANGGSIPGSSQLDAADFHQVATSGTTFYNYWQQQLQTYFTWIKAQVASGNTIIFRPFSELNGNWNWFGGQNPADFIALWQSTWTMAESLGLNGNILWNYNVNAEVGNYTAYYPGSQYVDIVSLDLYDVASNIVNDANNGNLYADLVALNKPLIFAEIGLSSPNPSANTLYDDQMLTIFPKLPAVVGWINWCQGWDLSNQYNAKNLLTNASVVNVGQLAALVSSLVSTEDATGTVNLETSGSLALEQPTG